MQQSISQDNSGMMCERAKTLKFIVLQRNEVIVIHAHYLTFISFPTKPRGISVELISTNDINFPIPTLIFPIR